MSFIKVLSEKENFYRTIIYLKSSIVTYTTKFHNTINRKLDRGTLRYVTVIIFEYYVIVYVTASG